MRAGLSSCLMILGLFSALTVSAAPSAVIDALQAPAWVERGERRVPLTPGMALENRDRVLTGAGARVIIQLADGSSVKLGEQVSMAINAMNQPKNGVFTAALDVAKGAFRLTTDIFRKFQDQRAINIRTGTVTIGIRGTDLWGRSDSTKDFVCLLEGKIAVSHPLGEPTELNEPLQYYGADKGQAPGPVAVVDKAQLLQWAQETELQAGAGTQQQGGTWMLRYGRYNEPDALAVYDRLMNAGYATKIKPFRSAGGYVYEVRLMHLVTERAAHLMAARLTRELQLAAPGISRH